MSTFDGTEQAGANFYEILDRLRKRLGIIALVVFLSSIAGILIVLGRASQAPTPIVYYVNLIGIENGEYPSGVSFSANDIVAPEVLAELVEEFGRSTEDLSAAISVSLGSPLAFGIVKKHTARLSQKGLTAAEIDEINTEMRDELHASSEKYARIFVDFRKLGLSEEQGKFLATILPKKWEEVFTKKYRVLDNTKLSSASTARYIALSEPAGVIEATNHVETMLAALKIIQEDGRLAGLQTIDGTTAADLSSKISNFNDLYLSAVVSENLSDASPMIAYYQTDLRLRIEQLDEQISSLRQSIRSIQQVITGEVAESGRQSGNGQNNFDVNGNAIGEIVELVNRSELAKYLTSLHSQVHSNIELRSQLTLRLKKNEQRIGTDIDFVKYTEAQLNEFNEQYVELLIDARAVSKRVGAEFHSSFGEPYRATDYSLSFASFLTVGLAAFVGTFFAVLFAGTIPYKNQGA